jgi:hypothetical protein
MKVGFCYRFCEKYEDRNRWTITATITDYDPPFGRDEGDSLPIVHRNRRP